MTEIDNLETSIAPALSEGQLNMKETEQCQLNLNE